MPHKFEPCRKDNLDSPERHKALPPETILSLLPLAPGQAVADIGCGTGYFTLPLAAKLPRGRVFAVDISQEMLDSLRDRLARSGDGNVQLVKSEELDIPLPPGSLDGALLSLVLHESEDSVAFLKAVKRLLRPGAWLGLVEWVKRETAVGPPLAERIAPAAARALAEKAGLKAVTEKPLGADFYFMLLQS
ncbi:MAG: class I SAM-dependent methyltransferase [Chloroflexi bacterium]|nr:class I SAM-dependent methyltransferase [Chloroflexota bacterium]